MLSQAAGFVTAQTTVLQEVCQAEVIDEVIGSI